jgi:hypothetical protein
VLQHALRALGQAPERDAQQVATSALAVAGAPNLAVDGPARRRQRPRDAVKQKAHDSGKKKTHTDKNILLINEHTSKVVYLGPTVPGKTHDKKAADEEPIAYRPNTTLDQDTGFQGYEPAGVLTTQPKKTSRHRAHGRRKVLQPALLQDADRGRTRARGGQTVSESQRCPALDHRGYVGYGDGDCVRLTQSPRLLPSSVACV